MMLTPMEESTLLNFGLLPPRNRLDGEWNLLGSVVLDAGDEDQAATSVGVEVCEMPATFWRFTITRPPDTVDRGPEDTETLIVKTGSGAFLDYWGPVGQVARHMLSVEGPNG